MRRAPFWDERFVYYGFDKVQIRRSPCNRKRYVTSFLICACAGVVFLFIIETRFSIHGVGEPFHYPRKQALSEVVSCAAARVCVCVCVCVCRCRIHEIRGTPTAVALRLTPVRKRRDVSLGFFGW